MVIHDDSIQPGWHIDGGKQVSRSNTLEGAEQYIGGHAPYSSYEIKDLGDQHCLDQTHPCSTAQPISQH